MSEAAIDWPWQYSFPPFFTIQPHPETRAKQVSAWKALILEYCQKTSTYMVDVRESGQLSLFHNSSINRKLDPSVISSILSELAKVGNAAPIDKGKNRWEIYWHTLEEWASMLFGFVIESGKQNTILTLFELTQGEDVQDKEWCGMSVEIMIKVLRVLENERKCELILSDEEQGVKFF